MVLIENRTETELIDENPEPHSTVFWNCITVLLLFFNLVPTQGPIFPPGPDSSYALRFRLKIKSFLSLEHRFLSLVTR